MAAFKGRTIATFHTEGAGGGHAPDIIKVCGEPNVLPSSTNPTHALHRQHRGRAPGHADGLPPSRSVDRGRCGLRRVAHPARDHRRRGHPARPGRFFDDVLRLAGHGKRRRSDHPHLADRGQDESAARGAEERPRQGGQHARQALHRQVHDQSRHRPGHFPRSRIDRSRQAGRPRDLETGIFRRETFADPQGRHDRGRRHGRPERVDPHAAAGSLSPDVRRASAAPSPRRSRSFRRRLCATLS